MKLFAITIGTGCGVGLVLAAATLAILRLIGVGDAIAVPAAMALAGTPIAASKEIAELIERREGKRALAAGKRIPIYDFRGFQIAWPLMVVFGPPLIWGPLSAVVGLTVILVSAILEDAKFEDIFQVLFVPIIFMQVLAAYFVGRWIGTRCSRNGVMTMFLVALLSAAGLLALDVAVLPHDVYVKVFHVEPQVLLTLLERLAAITLSFLVGGLLGYWRGRKYRLPAYLHYLLGILPEEDADAVVELAFDAAQKVASTAGRR